LLKQKFKSVLPDWGPYSKKYMGISHIVDSNSKNGARFDCVVYPTIANSSVPVPNVTVPSNYHPWNAKPDLSFYQYRYDLEWKDQVYADVSFTNIDDNASLIRVGYKNNTNIPQNCLLNFFCAIEYPHRHYCSANLPEKHVFFGATDYERYDYAVARPWDMQNPDGAKKGEFSDPLFTNGNGLGDRCDASHVPQLTFRPFGGEKGDSVSYVFDIDSDFKNSYLCVRYRTVPEDGADNVAMFKAGGIIENVLKFNISNSLTVAYFPIGALSAGKYTLSLISEGTGGVELDCFAVVENNDTGKVNFKTEKYGLEPDIRLDGSTAIYHYQNIPSSYGIRALSDKVRYRYLPTGTLEDAIISRLTNSDCTFDDVMEPFTHSFSRKHSDDGFYANTIVHSIFIPANSGDIEYAIVFKDRCPEFSKEKCEKLYEKANSSLPKTIYSEKGKPYEFSNRLLRSTLLCNIVYPIYKHGEYIKHHTPGKRWDSLYTWDSGFIGLGLLETEPKLAEYILDTYLSDENNKDYAFLHHGSPVPVQIYLYLELLNRTNDKTELKEYYKRARLYYEFLAGKAYNSTTAHFKSGLTSTYDLFYSSSGMDDYPAQVYIHDHGFERSAAPAISTSQAIRFGKILRMIALHNGIDADISEYDADIKSFTSALQKYSWDEGCGYFSYVIHDADEKPIGFMRNKDGENMNKGFDGVYPLIAGACTNHQKDVILGHLKSPKELFSPVGLSAVDMSAGYFINNGYWNGSVWFSHQWFLFKTMIDIGETDFAFKIADTALKSWKTEVDHSYNCFEMLNIATGRGGWFHQFGGLSAPINIWANAYYKKGTITGGFDLWISQREFSGDYSSCGISFEYYGESKRFAIVAVMNDQIDICYTAAFNGQPLELSERFKGVIELKIDGNCRKGRIEIHSK
jgi:hypothetical protein